MVQFYNEETSRWKYLILISSFFVHLIIWGFAYGAGVFQVIPTTISSTLIDISCDFHVISGHFYARVRRCRHIWTSRNSHIISYNLGIFRWYLSHIVTVLYLNFNHDFY